MKSNTMNSTDNMAYFYEELPMKQVLATTKEIHKRLNADDMNLALKCSPCAAYITLNLNNGDVVYVARKRDYQSASDNYKYTVQVLEDNDENQLDVVHATTYVSDGSITSEVPDNMLTVAAKVIRMSKRR